MCFCLLFDICSIKISVVGGQVVFERLLVPNLIQFVLFCSWLCAGKIFFNFDKIIYLSSYVVDVFRLSYIQPYCKSLICPMILFFSAYSKG